MLEALTGPTAWRPEPSPWLEVVADPVAVEAAALALSRGGVVWVVGPLAAARAVARAASGSGAIELDLRGCSHATSARVRLGQLLGRFPAAGPLGPPPSRTVAGCSMAAPLLHAAGWLGSGIARAWFSEQAPPEGGAPIVTVGAPAPPTPDPLPDPTPWLAIADGAPLPQIPCVADAVALEAAIGQDGRAVAAAARLWGRWGALDHARQILHEATARSVSPAAQGRLAWAEADVLDRWGAPAGEAWDAARRALTGSPDLLGAMLRGQAALDARRGDLARAERLGAEAAHVARDAGRSRDLPQNLLGSALLALRAAQPIGARVLLDQLAGSADDGVAASARLTLGALDPTVALPAHALALPESRAAALLLAASRADDATAAAPLAQARALYVSLGEPAGLALAHRLEGDAAARAGAWAGAVASWRRALALHVIDRDAPAAACTLDRLGQVARAAGDLEAAAAMSGLSLDLSGDPSGDQSA